MERVDYYTGAPANDNLANLTDPNDDSAQYAFNVADYYQYQQQNEPQPDFMNAPAPAFPPNYGQGYTGPGPNSQIEISRVQYQQPQQQIPPAQYPQQPYGQPYGYTYPQPNYYQQVAGYYGQQQMNYGYGYGQPVMNMGMGYSAGAPMNVPHFGGGTSPYQAPVNQQPIVFPNYQPNPVFQMGSGQAAAPVAAFNPYTQQAGGNIFFNPTPNDKVVHVPGLNPTGGTALLPADIEEKLTSLQMEMNADMEAAAAKRQQRTQGYFNANGFNYYGMPFVNMYFDQGVYNDYMAQVREIANQAIEKRRNLNKNLAKVVYGFLGYNYTDEEIDEQLNGYDYTIPGSTIQETYQQQRFARLQPIDTAAMYRAADAQISAAYKSLMPSYGSGDMNEWLRDCGNLILADKLEEQYHKNRDLSGAYNKGTYANYLRKFALDHDMAKKEEEIRARQEKVFRDLEKGDTSSLPQTREEAIDFLFGSEALQRVQTLNAALNGTGIMPAGPPDQFGTPVVVSGEKEQEYEMRRNAFIESIYDKKSYAQRNWESGVT